MEILVMLVMTVLVATAVLAVFAMVLVAVAGFFGVHMPLWVAMGILFLISVVANMFKGTKS